MDRFRIVVRRLGSGIANRYRAYVIGLATMALLIAVRRYFLDAYFDNELPLRLFILPVIAAAWSGGLKPGLLTTFVCCVAAPYFFGDLAIESIDWRTTLIFLVVGVVVSGFMESLHVTRHRLEDRQCDLEREMAERRKAESGLREQEERVRMAVESANIGTWDLNVLTGERKWGDRSKAMFGLSADEDVSRISFIDLLHPDDRERVQQARQRALDPRGGGRYEVEYRVRWRDGTIRWIIAKGQAFFHGEGEMRRAVRFIGTVFDFTEHKQLEEALQDADRQKDEFLATLAHELRNPLAPVRNAVQILHLKGPPIPELQWARDVIDRQMQQMSRIVDDLLDVSRISRNTLELRKERVELTKVIQGAVETSRPLIEASNHELTVSLPPQAVFLDADLTRLAQCISNLLNNASKFTGRGGRIWLTAEREGSDAVVTVKDTGIGISADQLPRIFEMFTQVDRSLERTQGGLGIGLSLVQRIVEMHGGTIVVHSDGPRKGSEFVIRLPVVVEPPPNPERVSSEHSKMLTADLRILVVDDNQDSASSMAMMLRIMGNEVQIADDGEQAVRAAAEFQPDVVLLDIGLPKLNGYEAAQRIREQPYGKRIVLIAMTGWGQEEDKRRAHEAGFDLHMVKPVDPTTLMRILAELHTTKGSASV